MGKRIVCAVVTVLLSGCMIGPDYLRPGIDIPPAWRFADNESTQLANTLWWEQFQDPVLNKLIQTALKESKDLLIAAARIDEFLGLYGETRADLFPQAGASWDERRQRITKETPDPLPTGTHTVFNAYRGLLNASWEIDIWGRLRRETEAARANLLSAQESRRMVVLTLVSAVANSYIDLCNLDRQLEIARRTVQVRKETYDLFTLRFQHGVISDLELYQVKSEYENTLSSIPEIEKNIARQENALSVLLGSNPGPISRGKNIDGLTLPAIPAGMPSDILERRPDIREAEQNLVAANARIGAARALYFPSISLTGFTGSASTHLSDLFSGPAHIWNYAGQATVPIFTAGRISGLVKSAQSVQQEMLARYQQAIRNGFREVDDALVDHAKIREQLQAKAQYVDSLRNYARVARLRFDEGFTSYIEVLDAERSLFAAELSYTQTHAALFRTLVNLYKALGGGWVDEADRMTAATPADGDNATGQ